MVRMLFNNLNTRIIIVISVVSFLSIFSFLYYSSNAQHLPYADAISRLNIARKVIDNITPGLAQVGNVWLPLPQILMIPFIWNDFMWHSGFAGSIMSMTMFILGGIFIYKTALLLTKSFLPSLLSLSIYALNINILYLQTTAMSESVFLCTLAATIYYFVKWFKTDQKIDLILAALSVSAMTLTRYEGLAVLLSSIPMVAVYTFLKHRKYAKVESTTLVYTVLACLGFGLWTLYLTAIFGDPLYWKTYYATPQATGGDVAVYTQAKPFLAAVWQYTTSFAWMNGIIPTVFSLIAIPIILIHSLIKKNWYFLPLLMPLSIFLFMVMTLMRNTPIVQPSLSLGNILDPKASEGVGFNIRYGLLLLPWVAVVSAYLFRFKYVNILLFLVFSLQLIPIFKPIYSPIYQISAKIYGKPYGEFVGWMKQNYDGGLILISASSHEDQMFEMGFPYKTYIHEGTNKYWKESLDNPSRYATWVVVDQGHDSDKVARLLSRPDILDRDYTLMYDNEQVKVFRIKDKPYFEIGKEPQDGES